MLCDDPHLTEEWSRFVPLEGGFNVRDLGGYPASGGRTVRRGLVYRSGSLSSLTDADVISIKELCIQLIVDLRSTTERTHRPSRLISKTWTRDYDSSDADIVRALRDPATTAVTARDLMIATYRRLIDEQAASFAHLFRQIARGELPVLFHCAAGKDRTGVAAMLLLELLGVHRQDIEDDYLHSRATVDHLIIDARASLAQYGIVDIDGAVLAPILGVERAYLDALFDEIEARFGTIEIYAYRQLGLTSSDLAGLRSHLLETGA